VRDPLLAESLNRLAAEAATRFSSLVATGDEIPFDVAEQDGDASIFYRYVPLTARFVRQREAELRSLPAYGPAREAVAAAGIAAPYLEAHGQEVPADPSERAAAMLISFIAALWDGCGEFSLDRPRLERALTALDCETRDIAEADVLIAPLVGLKMSLPRLDLPSGVQIVRADAVDAPIEAMRSEGMNRAAWEPQFLAIAEQSGEPRSSVAAMGQLRDLISVMRLFKEGGIGLGPHVFASTGDGHWRRIATGAPATRPGGYQLTDEEAAELRALARDLVEQPDPRGALAWAIARFEMGCERVTALEGLSDHLLALRALLEGDGPVGADPARRAAALFADFEDREEAADRVTRAFELERTLMTGERMERSGVDTGTALGLSVWIEAGLRAILRRAALGELGRELGVAADEALISSGLSVGEAPSEEIDDWGMPDPTILGDGASEPVKITRHPNTAHARTADPEQGTGDPAAPGGEAEEAAGMYSNSEETSEITRILEPIPAQEEEIRVHALKEPEPEATEDAEDEAETESSERDWGFDDDDRKESPMPKRDWLSEVSPEERATLEWPVSEGTDPRERERIDTPRVRHLFQVPEDAEWEVRELEYDRRRTASR
jgi:hypothetical protein